MTRAEKYKTLLDSRLDSGTVISWGFAWGRAVLTKRGLSSKYLGAHFAIAMAFAAGLGSSLQVHAQDLNAQTQATITAPLSVAPPADVVSSPLAHISQQKLPANPRAACVPQLEQLKSAADRVSAMPADEKKAFLARLNTTAKLDQISEIQKFISQHPRKCVEFFTSLSIQPGPIVLSATTAQPTKVKVSLVLNPTYETDVLKSGNNSSPGESAGFGSNVLITTAGLRPWDLYSISAAEGSSRYTPFSSQSTDVVNSYLAYTAFLHADAYSQDGTLLHDLEPNKSLPNVPVQNMATIDTVTFGIQNQALFVPTFHRETVDFATPQVTLSRQNINLDGADLSCSLPLKAFCDFASVFLNVGQSFSDVPTQQNFNVAESATIGRRIDGDWTIQLQGTATGKEYEHVVGGRQDLLLQVGPALTYIHQYSDYAISFQLPVTYYKNYSTLSAAAWSGLVIQPTLSIAFLYGPK